MKAAAFCALVVSTLVVAWGVVTSRTALETRRSQDGVLKTLYWNEGLLTGNRGDEQEVVPGIQSFRQGNWAIAAGSLVASFSLAVLVKLTLRTNGRRLQSTDVQSIVASRELLLKACREALDECTRAREKGHMPGKGFVTWLGDVVYVSEGRDPSQRWGVGVGNVRAAPIQAEREPVQKA